MSQVGGISGLQLRSFIERIERLEDEKKEISDQIREVFAEAKGEGFDVKTMRQVLRLRRMKQDELAEQDALLDIYRQALGMLQIESAEEAA